MKTSIYTLKYISTPEYDSSQLSHYDFYIWKDEQEFETHETIEFGTKEEAEQKLKELSENNNSFKFKNWNITFNIWIAQYTTTTYKDNTEIDVTIEENSYEETIIEQAKEFTKLKQYWEKTSDKINTQYLDNEITTQEYNHYRKEYEKEEKQAYNKYGNELNAWE